MRQLRHQIRFETSEKFKCSCRELTSKRMRNSWNSSICVANGVSDSKRKKAVLLTSLSTETYQLAKNLVAPTLLRKDSLTHDTFERLQKQLKPEQPHAKRGRTVSQDDALQKHLAKDCKFSEAMPLEDRLNLVSGG